jgi:hypothetical protein
MLDSEFGARASSWPAMMLSTELLLSTQKEQVHRRVHIWAWSGLGVEMDTRPMAQVELGAEHRQKPGRGASAVLGAQLLFKNRCGAESPKARSSGG